MKKLKILTCAITALSLPALADNITWDGGGVGDDFLTAENWVGDAVPGVNDSAIINADNTAVYNNVGVTTTVDSLRLGAANGSATGELDVQAGTLTFAGTGLTSDVYRDSSGTMRVSGGTLNLDGGGNFRFGHRSGSHDFVTVTSGAANFAARVNALGSNNASFTATLSGGTTSFTGTHADMLGARTGGASYMSISNSAVLTVSANNGFRLGEGTVGGTNTLDITGGTLNAITRLTMGSSTDATNIINVSGGDINGSNVLQLQANGATSLFSITGSDATIDFAGNVEANGGALNEFEFILGNSGGNHVSLIDTAAQLKITTDTVLTIDAGTWDGTGSTNIVLFEYDTISGSGLFDVQLNGLTGTLNYAGGTGNQVVLEGAAIIPEPGTYAALAGIIGLGIAVIRRRRV
ncbi:PEP-CTERM sorting domain-containing protein [Rubellicoccus peritrichatus]|uniref:PEP-CTERM sorting domain-containing protein n=1 Tax=Rubellicoccus peritrichatus TaxID=3080537 RepID=A0AAQ3QQY0_9BACT|nr:PEP-CTERM sorting domain-containing protein [Puniceicoccus sp. CR14]WOO40733.1 PEP-CTERM sorting domain-containing protein [Puniceicoccus sp. CR14]